MTNEELYKNLQIVSKKIAERTLRRAGHCLRHPEEIASYLVLWQPTIGSTSRGRKATTFFNTLRRDTDLDSIQEIKVAMDRRTWNSIVKSVQENGLIEISTFDVSGTQVPFRNDMNLSNILKISHPAAWIVAGKLSRY